MTPVEKTLLKFAKNIFAVNDKTEISFTSIKPDNTGWVTIWGTDRVVPIKFNLDCGDMLLSGYMGLSKEYNKLIVNLKIEK